MTQRQNLHYRIASQQKLKSDTEYIPKSAQIKLELSVENETKEGEAFQGLQEKHSQVLADCQLKLKSLVIEAGDIDLVDKKEARQCIFRGVDPRHLQRIPDVQ